MIGINFDQKRKEDCIQFSVDGIFMADYLDLILPRLELYKFYKIGPATGPPIFLTQTLDKLKYISKLSLLKILLNFKDT